MAAQGPAASGPCQRSPNQNRPFTRRVCNPHRLSRADLERIAGDAGEEDVAASGRVYLVAVATMCARMNTQRTRDHDKVCRDGPRSKGDRSMQRNASRPTRSLVLCVVTLCFLLEQTAVVARAPAPTFNGDPKRVRAIVQDTANKLGAKAVVFGMWRGHREVLTMALGESMTGVPATTDMHYRIGGIAEPFMSTLLLMLVEQKRIGLDDKISRWFPELLAADQVTVRMLVSNTAGYIDYVTVPDFRDLVLAEPFRTVTDAELIDYSVRDGKMNFPP